MYSVPFPKRFTWVQMIRVKPRMVNTFSIFRRLPKDHQIIKVQLEYVLNALDFSMDCYWNYLQYILQYT